MTLYDVRYSKPAFGGAKEAVEPIEADTDAAARLKFLNLPWVAFTDIAVIEITPAAKQPRRAKPKEAEDVSALDLRKSAGGGTIFRFKDEVEKRAPAPKPKPRPLPRKVEVPKVSRAEAKRAYEKARKRYDELTDQIERASDQASAFAAMGQQAKADANMAAAKRGMALRADAGKQLRAAERMCEEAGYVIPE